MKFLTTKISIIFFLFCFFVQAALASSRCELTDTSKISSNSDLTDLLQRIMTIMDRNMVLKMKKEEAIRELEGIRAAKDVGVGVDPTDEFQLKQVVKEGTDAEIKEATRGVCDYEGCYCDTTSYRDQAFNQVRELCGIDTVKSSCQPMNFSANVPSGAPSDSELDKMDIDKAMGFKGNLERALMKLADHLSMAKLGNQRCEEALQSSLLSDSCKGAYNQAFKFPLSKEHEIAERCKPEFIDGDVHYSLKNLFIESMRGFAQESCEVMQVHLTNKALERQLYNRVQAVRASIQCLNHLGPEGCRAKHLGRKVANE